MVLKIEMPKRKYDDSHLDYGFTFLEERNEQLLLSNDSMKPHQLKKHLSNVHPEFVGKERQFFVLKTNYLKKIRIEPGRKISNRVESNETRIICCFAASGEGEEAT